MIPSWATRLPWREITIAAETHKLSPQLVAAIVQTESGGQTLATRFEKGWRWFDAPESHAQRLGISLDTERAAQATSFGLLQLMGGTARSIGFPGHLTELLFPAVGLDWGCRYLARQVARYGDEILAVAAYNAGSVRYRDAKSKTFENQAYVNKVARYWRELEGKVEPA